MGVALMLMRRGSSVASLDPNGLVGFYSVTGSIYKEVGYLGG